MIIQNLLNLWKIEFMQLIKGRIRELIWFLNHDHIYTIGTSGNKNEIHTANNLPVFETNRGGKSNISRTWVKE